MAGRRLRRIAMDDGLRDACERESLFTCRVRCDPLPAPSCAHGPMVWFVDAQDVLSHSRVALLNLLDVDIELIDEMLQNVCDCVAPKPQSVCIPTAL